MLRVFTLVVVIALPSVCLAQTSIPLINDAVDGRLGISVQLGTDTNVFNYLLDTGSFIFTTALGTNSYWTGAITGTINSNTPFIDSYKKFEYQGDAATTTVTLNGSGTNPLVISNAQLGVITNVVFVPSDQVDSNWNSDVNSSPPYPPAPIQMQGGGGSWYGTFGVGLAQSGTNGGGLYTLLDQIPLTNGATKQGFVIGTGGPGGTATLTVGLNQSIINSYPILLDMSTNNTQNPQLNPYGTTVVSLNGVTNNLYPEAQLSGSYTFSSPTGSYTTNAYEILDTGEDGGEYNFGTNSAASIASYTNGSGDISVGTLFSITNPPSADSISGFDWTRLAGAVPYVDQIPEAITTNAFDTLNTGIDLFYQYNVMFDTQDGLIGLEPIAPTLFVNSNSISLTTNITSGTNFYSFTYVGYATNFLNNSLVVSGAGTVLTNANGTFVGESGSGNSLIISNGGLVIGYCTVVGDAPTASNNSLLVTGSNSLLQTTYSDLDVGVAGSGNSLVISNGGTISVQSDNNRTVIGYTSASSNNSVLVTDSGSLLTNSSDLYVGYDGSSNSVMVSHGGTVSVAGGSYGVVIGLNSDSSNNCMVVTGAGSFLTNSKDFYVGNGGSGNTLSIVDGGEVSVHGNVYIGYEAGSSENSILVSGTNANLTINHGLVVGDDTNSGNSMVISNGATVQSGVHDADSDTSNGSGIGYYGGSTSSNNWALITGAGSLWKVVGTNGFWVGYESFGSSLIVSNGGMLSTVSSYIGSAGGSNNSVLITGAGSLWSNSEDINIGGYGTNQPDDGLGGSGTLTIAQGGSLITHSLVIASGSNSLGVVNVGTFGGSDTGVSLVASNISFGSGAGALNFNQADSSTVTSEISGKNSLLQQLGSGLTILTGSNSYSGPTLVQSGELDFANTLALYGGKTNQWTTTNLIVGSGGTAIFAVGGSGYFTPMELTELASLATTNGGFQSGSSFGIDITGTNFTDSLNLTNPNTGSNSLGFTVIGAGTLNLTGSNSYSGATLFDDGSTIAMSGSISNNNSLTIASVGASTLTLESGTSLAANSIILAANSNSIGTLNVGSVGESSSKISLKAFSLTLGLGSATVNFNQSNTMTIAAAISGTGSVNQLGSGTTILTGANYYGGTTVIQNGTLQIGDGSSSVTFGSDTSTLDIDNNSSLILDSSTNLALSGDIDGNGSITQSGKGVTVFGGTNSYRGASVVRSGTLEFLTTNSLYSGNNSYWIPSYVKVASNATVAFGVGSTTGSFTMSNVTTLLANLQNATGNTNGLEAGASIGFDATGTNFILTNNLTNSGSGSLGLASLGTGTLTLTGSNTYRGPTVVQSGDLEFGNTLALYGGKTNQWTASNLRVEAGATAIFAVGGVNHFSSTNLGQLTALATSDGGFESGSSFGIDTTGTNFTYAHNLSDLNGGKNSLGFTVLGTGTLNLTGRNSYSGATLFDGGNTIITGSISNSSSLTVGSANSGVSLVISNGAMVVDGGGTVGNSAVNETVTVTGSNSLWSNSTTLYVGDYGAGNSLIISNGATVSSGYAEIGLYSNNNSAVVSGSHSLWTNSGTLLVGDYGVSNSLVISNGGTVLVNDAEIGIELNDNSALITGSNSLWSNYGTLSVGDYGSNNSLVISNGATAIVGSNATIGYYGTSNSLSVLGGGMMKVGQAVIGLAANNNSALVSGSNSLLMDLGSLYVGYYGGSNSWAGSSNTFSVSNGGKLETANGYIGAEGSSGDTVLITGSSSTWSDVGTITVGGDVNDGSGGSGTLTIGSGAEVTSSNVTIANGSNTMGTLNIGTFEGSDTNVTLTASSIEFAAVTGTLNFNQSDTTTIAAPISGTGTVQQLGSGTTILTAASTYSGTTTIASGTLLLSKGASLSGSTNINLGTEALHGTLDVSSNSSYTLSSSQTLSGYGVVNAGSGTVTVNGAITPGSIGSIDGTTTRGLITVNGSLVLASSAVTTLTLTGTNTAGINYDAVKVTGTLNYNGTLDLVMNSLIPGTFDLFGAGTFAGNFQNVLLAGSWMPGSFTMGGTGIWSYSDHSTYDLIFTPSSGVLEVMSVPEPATWSLLSIAFLSAIAIYRRKSGEKLSHGRDKAEAPGFIATII